MRRLAVACLGAGLLGACATPDAERFIDRYRLQADAGPLYEILEKDRIVGWLYGAVHYGTVERPSLSRAAVRTLARTRHVYLESTDGPGNPWPMRNALPPDLEQAAQAKGQTAKTSGDRVWQGVVAAKRTEHETDGVAAVLAEDKSYYENFALAYNYCGAFYEYGTERLVVAFVTGQDVTIHALETEASRREALDEARSERCKPRPASTPAGLPRGLEQLCSAILEDIHRDQREDRPYSPSGAATCVLDTRHRTMAARISQAVKAGEKPFIVVGRGHLVHGRTLVEMLAAQGLVLRRID
jgi:hypothetical protein